MKKLSTILLACCFCSHGLLTAQDMPSGASDAKDQLNSLFSSRKNVSKTTLLPGPLFQMFGVSQERVLFLNRITMQTTVKGMPGRHFSSNFGKATTSDGKTYNPFSSATLSAIGNVTEFRIYGKKKGALKGFYWGPYFTYTFYKLQTSTFPGDFKDNNGVQYHADLQQVVKLGTIGGGLQIGVQGMIKDRVVIDWTILGVGFGSLNLSSGIDASNTSSNFDFRNYTNDIDKTSLGIEKYFPVKRTVEKESVSLGAKVPIPMIRMGVSFGIAY